MPENSSSTNIEQQYQACVAAMSPQQRFARGMALLQWTRESIGRQIVAERGPMSDARLKLEVGKRLYAAEPAIVALIEQRLAEIPN